jgi:hypothetical protein
VSDNGQAAVAAVEDAAFGGTTFDQPAVRRVVEECIGGVLAGPWWRANGPAVVVVTPRRSARSSNARTCGDGVQIRLTDEQLTVGTVVHELAHALAGVDRGHDAVFRAAHVDVTALLGGPSMASALRTAYRDFQLDVADRQWSGPYRAIGDGFVLTV